MSKDFLRGLVELVPEEKVEEVFRILVKFIPEDDPLPDEIEALMEGRKSREKYGVVSHDEINWD